MTSTQQHFCARQGTVVDPSLPISEDEHDYVWPCFGPVYGCNHLVCGRCNALVANAPGWTVHRTFRGSEGELLTFLAGHAMEDAERRELLRRSTSRRLYHCNCSVYCEKSWADIACPNDDREDNPPAYWRCAGHPVLELPAYVDGVRLDASMDWRELVTSSALGLTPRTERCLGWPSRPYWLLRLYFLLSDDARPLLASALRSCLFAPQVEVRACVVDVFRHCHGIAGSEACIEAALDHPKEWLDIPNPIATTPLHELLAGAVAPHIPAHPRSVHAGRFLAIACDPGSILIGALFGHDREWFLDNISNFACGSPSEATVAFLLLALKPLGKDSIEPALRLGRAGYVPLPKYVKLVRQALQWDAATAVIATLTPDSAPEAR